MSALGLAVFGDRFFLHRQIWEYMNVPLSMDYFNCSNSTHLFTLVRLHFVPWFPFSVSMGYLTSVNGIHQWPVIRQWTTMFDLNTSIPIVGHVLVAVCVEDLSYWWHPLYATSLIMPVLMRFQPSWLDTSVCQIFPATMEILIYCISSSILEILIYFILYMVMTTHVT